MTGMVMFDGIKAFSNTAREIYRTRHSHQTRQFQKPPRLVANVPARPPSFCIGCPERPIFCATEPVEDPDTVIAGCFRCLFRSTPLDIMTTMGYGLGAASAAAFNDKQPLVGLFLSLRRRILA